MIKLSLSFILLSFSIFSQTQYGPNNPAAGGNNTSVGTQSWTNPGNVVSSNNVRSSNNLAGITHHQTATNFGFAIPSPANINGIRMSVERNHQPPAVAALSGSGAWTSHLTEGTGSPLTFTRSTTNIPNGTDRCLVFVWMLENGNGTRDLTAVSYGGQAMTQVVERFEGANQSSGFSGRIEIWILLEAGIAAANAANNRNFQVTFSGPTGFTEYCHAFSSGAYENVDQTNPNLAGNFITSSAPGSTTTWQLGNNLSVLTQGMALNFTLAGHNGTMTINSAYTEVTDETFFNTGFAGTGASMQIAQKAITADGTERPTVSYTSTSASNTISRHAMIGLFLPPAPAFDNSIRLIKGGTIVGNNLANTTTRWPYNDASVNYGGAANLWGTTWTLADINATNFGGAVSATIQQGTANIDHIAMTVWATSTLPVELLDFSGITFKNYNQLNWMTASEINNAYFEIQSSIDGIHFNPIGTVAGNGNSSIAHTYSFDDTNPRGNDTYYRLKQVDLNGDFEYSPIILLSKESSDEISIFPNPNEGAFQIYNLENKIGTIDIYSSELKFMKQVSINAESDPIIHIEDLSNASYYLFVHEKTGTKIIKVYKATK